ncbi:MAG: SDR family oxidoreductase [Bacteroidia bacterium]|nr:SDR family oxidoreductase [Bacteroidia bacterium]
MEHIGKTIVITGCTKGIGLAIVNIFAQMGFNIAGCARNNEELSALQLELTKLNPNANHTLLQCDVSQTEEINIFIDKITKIYKRIDVLVNNAGAFVPGKVIDEAAGTLEHLLQTNVTSAYNISRGFLPPMIEAKTGHIFNICSIASLQAYEAGGSYSISKFALLGFSKQLRFELKNYGVKVTAIMPGATLTNSWAGAGLPEERFIKPIDVAKTIKAVYELSSSTDVEEIVIRPQLGDI